MDIGLRDLLNLTPTPPRPASGNGLPAAADIRHRQQRLSALISKVGLFPLPLSARQQLGVPLTPYLLPRLLTAQRFVHKRQEIGRRAQATPQLLSALVRMEPALSAWEQALAQVEIAARHGVLHVLHLLSQRTDGLTERVEERLRAGGPGAARLRIRLWRIVQAQGQWEAAARARRERARRQREAGAQALEAAQQEVRLLLAADRLAQAGLPTRRPLPSLPPPVPTPVPLRRPAAGTAPGPWPDAGLNVSAEELTGLALEAGALAQGLGVPEMSEAEGAEVVLSIDPLGVVVANLYGLLLPPGPGPDVPEELTGLYSGDLVDLTAVLGEMVDLYQEAARGLRGARDGHLRVAAVAQQVVGRLSREIRAVVEGAPGPEAEAVRGDAGELLRLEEQEQAERQAAAERTRREREEQASAVRAVERQGRFLKTVLAMRNREEVSREELEEALAVYEEISADRMDPRATER